MKANAVSISSQEAGMGCRRRDIGCILVAMKIYEGGRSLDGSMVTVDGKALPLRHDLRRISKTGFEWGFEGPAPEQLALALLADHLGDGEQALRLHVAFMRDVVAHLDNAWRLTSAEVDAALGGG